MDIEPCREAAEQRAPSIPIVVEVLDPAVTIDDRIGGIGYLSSTGVLTLFGSRGEDSPVWELTLFGDTVGRRPPLPLDDFTAVLAEESSRVYALTAGGESPFLSLVPLPIDGRQPPSIPADRIDLRTLGTFRPGGATVSASDEIYLLDADAPRVLRAALTRRRTGTRHMSSACFLNLSSVPSRSTRLAVRPRDGHIFLAAQTNDGPVLYETAPDGGFLAAHEVLPAGRWEVLGMAFAPPPGLSRTGSMQLYVALQSAERQLRLLRLSFEAEEAKPPPVESPQLVRVIDTAGWDPPSPDPTGIAWNPATRSLIVTDSEVDEQPTFEGTNVWYVTVSGNVDSTARLRRSTEPTGVTTDWESREVYVADDSKKEIYIVHPGSDGLLGTRDDSRSRILDLQAMGITDPEGLAYGQGSLFVAGGSSQRIFRISPGPNGRFDGVAPRGDDEVASFLIDRGVIHDPEGVEFDWRSATLYVAGRHGAGSLAELGTDGRLLRTFALDGLSVRSLSGLAIAPATKDPKSRSLYLIDRGVDNAEDPQESDGRLIEVSITDL